MVNQSEVSLNEYSQVDSLNSDNSIKGEKSVAKDAEFWLPKITRGHFTWLSDDAKVKVHLAKDLDQLWNLPHVHQDNILAAWWSIYRKGRKENGERFINACLYQKAVCLQRLGRKHYLKVWQEERLQNPQAVLRKFDLFSDAHYNVFNHYIDRAMKMSAKVGKLPGTVKSKKTELRPEHILAALKLPITTPSNLQVVFIFTLMHLTGPRGGEKLRSLNFGRFTKVCARDRKPKHYVFNSNV